MLLLEYDKCHERGAKAAFCRTVELPLDGGRLGQSTQRGQVASYAGCASANALNDSMNL